MIRSDGNVGPNYLRSLTETSANLVLVQAEESPTNPDGLAVFAYFEGTPDREDLKAIPHRQWKFERHGGKKQVQNVLADRAGLERWMIGHII